MKKQQVIDIINKKIKDHDLEIIDTLAALDGLPRKPEEAHKMVILKDKAMFHKACMATLQDLKEDVNEFDDL